MTATAMTEQSSRGNMKRLSERKAGIGLVDGKIEMARQAPPTELIDDERRHFWELGLKNGRQRLVGEYSVLRPFGNAEIADFSPAIEREFHSDSYVEAKEILAR